MSERLPVWFLIPPLLAGAVSPVAAQIQVLTDFEGGNIGKVVHVSPAALRCSVQGQADHDRRNRQANWYYFELANLPRQTVTIELVDLAGEYNYRGPAFAVTKGTRPVYSYDGVNWMHFRDDQVSWENQEPRLTIRFTPERNRIWIAHVPPYTNRDLSSLLKRFDSSPYLARQVIGRTVEGREMLLLTITNPEVDEAKKKVIWLMFRQHAWETGSSWAADGAIRFLLSGDSAAVGIREGLIFKIFPMADPDGVASGAVRYNRNGYDLNRNWDTVDPRTMPEIAAQRQAILDWIESRHAVNLFLSLHNTETGEYLECPRTFRPLGERIFRLLVSESSFNPTTPLRDMDEKAAPGRMAVNQGLYHDRQIPAMLMEQMVEYNSKLGHCPSVSDRTRFGADLARALSRAVSDVEPPR